eukprot:2383981-Rhodomonas_salina.4
MHKDLEKVFKLKEVLLTSNLLAAALAKNSSKSKSRSSSRPTSTFTFKKLQRRRSSNRNGDLGDLSKLLTQHRVQRQDELPLLLGTL